MHETLRTNITEIGRELLAVKEALPEGSFGPWLRAELGWSEETARRFMAAATQLGGQGEEHAGELVQWEDVPMEELAAELAAGLERPREQ